MFNMFKAILEGLNFSPLAMLVLWGIVLAITAFAAIMAHKLNKSGLDFRFDIAKKVVRIYRILFKVTANAFGGTVLTALAFALSCAEFLHELFNNSTADSETVVAQ